MKKFVFQNSRPDPVCLVIAFGWLLVIGGIIEGILSFRLVGWGWMTVNGAITLILGILMWAGWPLTGLWIIGLYVGIHLLVRGIEMIAFGFAVRRLA